MWLDAQTSYFLAKDDPPKFRTIIYKRLVTSLNGITLLEDGRSKLVPCLILDARKLSGRRAIVTAG